MLLKPVGNSLDTRKASSNLLTVIRSALVNTIKQLYVYKVSLKHLYEFQSHHQSNKNQLRKLHKLSSVVIVEKQLLTL